MKTVHLARGLTLPAAELATEVIASLGQRGSGKSNGAGVVAEGLLAAGIQVIVLDHVGIWFSLRLDESGKRPSPYRIPVLGGQHGDIGLVATTGAVVAEALARSGSSAVLDVSAFSKGDRCRFAADFAEAFFAAKKLHPGPVQILLEEAQRYVPQKLFTGQGLERMLGAFEEIAEVGRNYGVGLHLISQRPQKINKDVLNLADTVLAYRTNGVLERKAISEWVQEKGAEGRKDMHGELPGLPRGTAIVWSPNRAIYGRYSVQKKDTYDAGATPTHARAAVKTKRLDLNQLEEAMGAAVEQAKANDPRALKAEIERLKKSGTTAALEREVLQLRVALEHEKEKRSVKSVQVPMLGKRDLKRIDRLQGMLKEVAAALDRSQESNNSLRADANTLILKLDELTGTAAEQRARGSWKDWTAGDVKQELKPIRGNGIPIAVPRRKPYIPPPGAPGTPGSRDGTVGGETDPVDLPKYAIDLLNVVAQRGKASDRQISVLSGYSKRSSAFTNNLNKLVNAGLLTGTPRERVITEAGRERTGVVDALPIGRALLDHWVAKLTGYEGLFLKTIHDAGTISREALAEQTGRSMGSSAFGGTISALKKLALIDDVDGSLTIAEAFN